MRIRTKFDGGKIYNICNRGSWHARCYGGALRMNLGPQWSCKAWESSTGTEPGYFFQNLYACHAQNLTNSNRYKAKPNVQKHRWIKKRTALKVSTSKSAQKAYGPKALDVTDNISSSDLINLQDEFLEKYINLSARQCKTFPWQLFNSHSLVFGTQRGKNGKQPQILVQ